VIKFDAIVKNTLPLDESQVLDKSQKVLDKSRQPYEVDLDDLLLFS
jgi:hypothetical protein